jgi:RTX calcium-binding nonapeptide repeat (4 copies)
VPIWYGAYDSHGLSISNSGNRAYVAGINSGLIILDTSEIQDRVPNPQVREVSRLAWESMSIPQNAIPVKIDGKEYVVEIDEFGAQEEVGAGRIINIEDESEPRVVSNLRLEVHQPENFAAQAGDPGTALPLQGYAGHYCNVPQRKDPGVVACSYILSGLRVFDIRDPRHPKEIAYFNAPVSERMTPGFEASNWAMSSPAFDAENGEIWYSDGFQGFYAVKVTNDVWPFPTCKGREATITSTKKVLRGTKKRDVIVGLRKTDRINGGRGDEVICGRGASDVIKGGRGDDELRGGLGHDRFVGGPGRDRFVSGKVLSR